MRSNEEFDEHVSIMIQFDSTLSAYRGKFDSTCVCKTEPKLGECVDIPHTKTVTAHSGSEVASIKGKMDCENATLKRTVQLSVGETHE